MGLQVDKYPAVYRGDYSILGSRLGSCCLLKLPFVRVYQTVSFQNRSTGALPFAEVAPGCTDFLDADLEAQDIRNNLA